VTPNQPSHRQAWSPRLKRTATIASRGGLWTGLNLCSAGLSAVAALLVAREGGAESFGVQSAVLGVAVLLAIVLDFGAATYTQRLASRDADDSRIGEAVLRRLIVLALCAAVSVTIAFISLGAALGVLYGGILATATLLGSIARGHHRFSLAASAPVVDKGCALFAVIILLGFAPNYALIGGMAIGTAVQCVVLLCCLDWRNSHWRSAIALAPTRESIRSSRSFFGISVLNEAQRLDVPIVQVAAGPVEAGLFAAPARLTGLLAVPASVVAGVLLTRLSRDRTQSRRLMGYSLTLLAGGYGALALVVAFAADWVVARTLGQEFLGAAGVLVIYCLSMLPQSFNQVFVSILAAHDRESSSLRRVASTAPLTLVLLLFGSVSAGAVGAAWAYFAGQTALCMALWLTVRGLNRSRT
jgi:O-antigen/teichoic acid export membrane protein